jgi:hypothetical protein
MFAMSFPGKSTLEFEVDRVVWRNLEKKLNSLDMYLAITAMREQIIRISTAKLHFLTVLFSIDYDFK